MNRGMKPLSAEEKMGRGTFTTNRDGAAPSAAELTEAANVDAATMPQMPEWISEDGKLVWLDNIEHVLSHRTVNEKDAAMFATFCNMQALSIKAWKKGEAIPVSHLIETRKMAEQFGLFGAKSRVGSKAPTNAATVFARPPRRV